MRCADFYKKWIQEPNWCEKTPGAVSQINSYLELVTEIHNRGIDKEIIYAKFPEGAARPVFTIKDDEVRIKILNYICACLNRAEKIQAGDLKNLVGEYEGKNARPKKVYICKDETTIADGTQTEAPPAPIAQTLKEKYGGLDSPATQIITPPIITDTIGQVSPITDTPWNCGVIPCPDGQDHIVVDKIRGKCCDLLSLPCNQLSQKRCPVLNGQVKPTGFSTADEFDPVTGGKLIKRPPYKITKAPEIIHFTPTPKQWEFIREAMFGSDFETPEAVVSQCIDRAMEES